MLERAVGRGAGVAPARRIALLAALTLVAAAVIGVLVLMWPHSQSVTPPPAGIAAGWSSAPPPTSQTTTQVPPTITTKGFCGLLSVAEVQAVIGPVTGSEESPIGCRWGEYPRDVAVVVESHTNPAEAAVKFKERMQRLDGQEAPGAAEVGQRSFYHTHYGRDGNVVWLQGSHVCSAWVDLPDRHTGNRPAALAVALLVAPRIP